MFLVWCLMLQFQLSGHDTPNNLVHRTIIRLIVGIHWIEIQTLGHFTEKLYNKIGVGPEITVLGPNEQFKIIALNGVYPNFETMTI